MVHEKMLSISNHQENANQNHSEILPSKWLLSKREYKTNVGEDMVSKEPCAPFVECRLFQPLYMEFPQKFENRIYTCQQTQF